MGKRTQTPSIPLNTPWQNGDFTRHQIERATLARLTPGLTENAKQYEEHTTSSAALF